MIHSARPIVMPVEHCFLLFCFSRFEKSGWTDGRTTCAITMIPTGRDFGLAKWINTLRRTLRQNEVQPCSFIFSFTFGHSSTAWTTSFSTYPAVTVLTSFWLRGHDARQVATLKEKFLTLSYQLIWLHFNSTIRHWQNRWSLYHSWCPYMRYKDR